MRGLFLTLAVASLSGCNQPAEFKASESAARAALLSVSPDFLDLGTIPQGGKVEAEVTLHNGGTEPIEITGSRSSCKCFTITPETDYVEPGQRVRAAVKIDLADEPKFIGKLDIETTGHAKDSGMPAFFIRVRIQVQARPVD
jgi:hypothetical protein